MTRDTNEFASFDRPYISVGFLTGNLPEDWDAGAYQDSLQKFLQARYPNALIAVLSQPGEGSLPYPLETYTDTGGAPYSRETDAMRREVEIALADHDNQYNPATGA